MKKLLSLLLCIITCISFIFCASCNNANNTSKNLISITMNNSKMHDNFLNACEQTNIYTTMITEFEKINDWIGGERFSFIYKGMELQLYTNMDSSIQYIKLGVDTDIYKQGFEPYNIEDFIVDTSIAHSLAVLSEEKVKMHLNYPSSASFPLWDWSYGRRENIYMVSGNVKASNAFGMEREIPFTCYYRLVNEEAELVYFIIDKNIVIDKMDTIKFPERQEVKNEDLNNSSDLKIHLIEGEMGRYGKRVIIDGDEYIVYILPAGTYKITNNGKWCKVYIEKTEYYINSDGWMENEIVQEIAFKEHGEVATFTIKDGEQISLTSYANVTLELIK